MRTGMSTGMSASPHFVSKLALSPDVLGELLHSLSQPLTSLQCSLELSLENSFQPSLERQRENVAAALQETGKVIGMIQLMREYLDAGQPAPEALPVAFESDLESTMRSVIEELSSIAAVRAVRLLLAGTCTTKLRMAESRLRLALQYLITPLIETQAMGGKVTLLLRQGPAGTLLRGEGAPGFRQLSRSPSTLRSVRLAIASRMLEGAGASLLLGDADSAGFGFVLRIPNVGDPNSERASSLL
jgi:hypothetical protein